MRVVTLLKGKELPIQSGNHLQRYRGGSKGGHLVYRLFPIFWLDIDRLHGVLKQKHLITMFDGIFDRIKNTIVGRKTPD